MWKIDFDFKPHTFIDHWWCRAATAAKAILPVLLVLGLWIGLFAMVGMQLFRCDYRIEDLCKVNMIEPSSIFQFLILNLLLVQINKMKSRLWNVHILIFQMNTEVLNTCPQYCSKKIGFRSSTRCVFTEEQVNELHLNSAIQTNIEIKSYWENTFI